MKMRTAVAFFLAVASAPAAHLSSAAEQAFDQYVASLERRLATQHSTPETYIAVLNHDPAQRSDVERQLRSGVVAVEPVNGGSWETSGALMHHWRAAAFVPGAKRTEMLTLLRNYDHLSSYYAPEIESSHLLANRGNVATLAIRLRKQQVVTVVLDAEYEIRTGLTGNSAGYEFSRSTHVWQVDEPGTPRERRRPEGEDDGFLWRLNAYWSFLQLPDGLLLECEAVSLTRDIPVGLHWLISPIIEDLPRTSLEFTLIATRNALKREH